MKKFVVLFVLIGSFALLVGCDFHIERGNVPAKLDLLTKTFGVQWPTNYIKPEGASLSADRGGPEVVVRLEISDSDFAKWRASATNRLDEFKELTASANPKLESRFGWWDCSKFPASRVTAYANDTRASSDKFVGSLFVFVVQTNEMRVMYIDANIP